jgi:membrane protease YdiL (CAAX protease family)
MNVDFQPRHVNVPLVFSKWYAISFTLNLIFGLGLLLAKRSRKLAFFPLLFSYFPLVLIIMAYIGPFLKENVPPSAWANGMDWKFLNDSVLFCLELFFIGLFFLIYRVKNPFAMHYRHAKELEFGRVIRFTEILFILVVFCLMLMVVLRMNLAPTRFFKLLMYLIPFSLLLGLKEELVFRWLLLRQGEKVLGSRLVVVVSGAVLWGLYHALFGEGIGVGVVSFAATAFVSLWWSFLAYRNNSIWASFFGHTMIEVYGFYLMYSPFLT